MLRCRERPFLVGDTAGAQVVKDSTGVSGEEGAAVSCSWRNEVWFPGAVER